MAEVPPFSLAGFHAGDRKILAQCYQEHFAAVEQAVGGLLTGADKETVVQDVFFRLLTESDFRATFQGGSLGAWLRTIARNRAIDHRRRYYDRERPLESDAGDGAGVWSDGGIEGQVEARMFFERLRKLMPEKLAPVFEKRFAEGLSQREAADALGLSRTTLAYREVLIRRLLRRALNNGEIT